MSTGLKRKRAGGHVPAMAVPVAAQAHVPQTNAAGTSYLSPTLDPPAPPPGPTNFLDSLYGLDASQILAAVQKQRAALEAQRESEQQNHTHALQQLAQARSKSLEGTRDNMNAQGLFYSGQLGKQYNNVNSAFDEKQYGENQRNAAALAGITNQLDTIGDIKADPSSPLGYTATGGAASSLYQALSNAAQRRIAGLGSEPVAVPAAPKPPTTTSPLAGAAKKRQTVYGRPLHINY